MRPLLNREPSLYDRAEAFRALASLLKAGLNLRAAVMEWPHAAPELPSLERVARRVTLGQEPASAVDAASDLLGEDASILLAAIVLHEEFGANPVPLLMTGAVMAERRADADAAGRAAIAGAKLSGWMVGGLPLVSLPLLPVSRAPLLDRPGLTFLLLGLVLTAAGMTWMARLVPDAGPSVDAFALFADHVAGALDAGAAPPMALRVACEAAPAAVRPRLLRACRRVLLGESWPEALVASAPELSGVADALRRSDRLGSPLVKELQAYAEARRALAERTFERTVRRAPVLMVLPLVLCVLPAFGLLAIVPFLRGISIA